MVYNHENDKLRENFVLFFIFSRLCYSYSEFKRIVIFLGCFNFFETMSWIQVRKKNDSIKNAREMRYYTLNCLGAASASTPKLDFSDVGQ